MTLGTLQATPTGLTVACAVEVGEIAGADQVAVTGLTDAVTVTCADTLGTVHAAVTGETVASTMLVAESEGADQVAETGDTLAGTVLCAVTLGTDQVTVAGETVAVSVPPPALVITARAVQPSRER